MNREEAISMVIEMRNAMEDYARRSRTTEASTERIRKAMKSLQDYLSVDRSEDNLSTEAANKYLGKHADITVIDEVATHDKRKETHGDLISRQAAIEMLNGMITDATSHGIAPRLDPYYVINGLEYLPSADTDMSDYSDRLWKAAYERGKAAMSQYVMDILDLMLDEEMVARIREWIDDPEKHQLSEDTSTDTSTCDKTCNRLATESKLKNPCDSFLTDDADECKEHKSKLDLVSREAAIEVLIRAIRDKFPIDDWDERLLEKGFEIEDLFQELPPITPTEKDKRIKELEDLFADMLESAQSVPMSTPTERTGEWIPVSERLPKEKQEVYVTVYFTEGDTGRAYGYIDGFGNWHLYSTVEGTLNSGYEVTAWMPLPKPYDGAKMGK